MGINVEFLVKTTAKITKQHVLEWAYDLASSFESGRFRIVRPENIYDDIPHHCLDIVDEVLQDGEKIYPKNGEIFIRVYLQGRYYNVGYEYGDLPFYINVAEWLESRLPEAEVWYGNDFSGPCIIHFDSLARIELWKHFCNVNHTPYSDYLEEDRFDIINPTCDLCKKKLHKYSWGNQNNFATFSCSGCGLKVETIDNGQSFYFARKTQTSKKIEWPYTKP